MTKTHLIDGVMYKEVERTALEGERVVVKHGTNGYLYKEVELSGTEGIIFKAPGSNGGRFVAHGEYRVLKPVESTPSAPPNDDLLEIVSNLTRRVHELERDNTNIKRDLGWYEFGPGRIANLRNGLSDIRHTVGQLEDAIAEIKAESEDWAGRVDDEQKKLRNDVTETLGTITDLLRRRDRRIEEIERKVFDTSLLKTFDFASLNGKQVTLLRGEDGGYEILAAKDEDGNFYVISEKEACE